jgi:hypothetical protein
VLEAFKTQREQISWRLENKLVDGLDEFVDLFLEGGMRETVFQPEVFNELNEGQHVDFLRFLFLPIKRQGVEDLRLFHTEHICVLRVELLVQSVVLFDELMVLTDFPLFLPLVIIVQHGGNLFLLIFILVYWQHRGGLAHDGSIA